MTTQTATPLIMPTRYFALIIGIAFTIAGVGGFIPGLTQPPPNEALPLALDMSYGYLLGLFPVNVLHNLFHLGIGLWGLVAYRQFATAKTFARWLGVLLGVLTCMGLVPLLNTTFGFFPLFGHDIWLHGLEAVIGLYLGFFSKPPTLVAVQS